MLIPDIPTTFGNTIFTPFEKLVSLRPAWLSIYSFWYCKIPQRFCCIFHYTNFYYLQRLGGLMSITVKVGLSMSLPFLLTRLSSYSGVKILLPLLVLKEWSVGLKLTGDRKLVPWVLLALGKVLRPTHENIIMLKLLLICCNGMYLKFVT